MREVTFGKLKAMAEYLLRGDQTLPWPLVHPTATACELAGRITRLLARLVSHGKATMREPECRTPPWAIWQALHWGASLAVARLARANGVIG